jgi:hypothetical protein
LVFGRYLIFDPPLNLRHLEFYGKNSALTKISVALWQRIFRLQDFFRAKNTPSEESSGRRILQQRIIRAFPSEELSGEGSSGRKILRRRNFRLRGFFFSSEEFSGEELSGQRIIRAKNFPAKNFPSEEIS